MQNLDALDDNSLICFESTPTPDLACQPCKAFAKRPWDRPHISLESLRVSAESGCQQCRLRHFGVLKALETRAVAKAMTVDVDETRTDISLMVSGWPGRTPCIHFFTEIGKPTSLWPHAGVARIVGTRKNTYQAVLQEWLKTCRKTHPRCLKNDNVGLPTRVLDVGSEYSGQIKLSEVPDTTGRYLALSHCWGGTVPMRTTRDNYDSYMKSIEFASLPKTFQDAVIVTRSLGLKHLWIDALCIIQDDEQDWAKESGKMASIYQNAYLVLGADMAKDSYGGFLETNEEPPAMGNAAVAIVKSEGTKILARWQDSYHENPCAILWPPGWDKEPLLERAWTLQEQILASRMVHFARKEVIWECDSALSCECMELDRADLAERAKPGYREALNSSSTDKFRFWYEIVNNFSRRNITKPSDVLPALSGLAHKFQEYGAGPYLAGIWQNDLPQALLWTSQDRLVRSRASPYRAPSWSWASLQSLHPQSRDQPYIDLGYVVLRPQRVYANVLGVECHAATSDLCGAVDSGQLRIRAPRFKVVYRDFEWQNPRKAVVHLDFDFVFQWKKGEALSCLFVGDFEGEDMQCWGLILQKRRDCANGTFERVGVFRAAHEAWHDYVSNVENVEVVEIV